MTENPLENQPPANPSAYPQQPETPVTPPTPPVGGEGQTPSPAVVSSPTPAPSEPLAIWALVCAIGSWILLPVVLAIVGLVLASQAKRAIAASGGTKSGEGLITATQVIAWVHLASVALFVIFIVAFAVGIVLSD